MQRVDLSNFETVLETQKKLYSVCPVHCGTEMAILFREVNSLCYTGPGQQCSSPLFTLPASQGKPGNLAEERAPGPVQSAYVPCGSGGAANGDGASFEYLLCARHAITDSYSYLI